MKIFIPKTSWIGNFDRYFKSAFKKNNAEVANNSKNFKLNNIIHFFKLQQITKVRTLEMEYYLKKYNEKLVQECIAFKPDVFLIFNESKVFTESIKTIREKCKCLMVCVLGDDPWDSDRFRFLPHSLKYFDLIFNAEPAWNINIRKIAPKTKIFWHCCGFDPDTFYPVGNNSINEDEQERLSCDLSFTGTSYGEKAEGAYRAEILTYLIDFNLKFWGDGWTHRFRYLPELKNKYQGDRICYEDLRKLYTLSKINLNMPAPQILTGFQPRVFEIAAVKGFQIADNRPLLRRLFHEDELVTFDTIGELREKIAYYLVHEQEREAMAEKLHKKVIANYTWAHWAKKILDTIKNPDNFEQSA